MTFDDVTFSYDGSINVLEHFNLDVKAGESIALVGPTGAGKTTVVNLISRFYNINSGRVLVDGHDISKVTLHSLRAQMGIMLQDSFIFSGTIMDNIRYGRLDATDEEIIAAAKTVRAHEFISEMRASRRAKSSLLRLQELCFPTRRFSCWTKPRPPLMRRPSAFCRKACRRF